MFDLSLSNGYLGNLVMMLGPQVFFLENISESFSFYQKGSCWGCLGKDHVGVALDYGSNQQQHVVKCFAQVTEVRDEQERIASLLVAILVLGIGAGSFLSYPIVNCL